MKKTIFCLFIMISYGSITGQYYDFEEWVKLPTTGGTVEYLTPSGTTWATSNEASMMFLAEPSVTRTTEAYLGTYAAKIKTIQLGDTKGSGALYTGKFKLDILNPLNSTVFGIPFTTRPLYLKGFYKFSPVAGDSCRIASYLTQWNLANNRRDTIAVASITREQSVTAVSVYTEFDIFYSYRSNNTPDSLTIMFASSADGAKYNAAIGTTLFIDEVSIEYYPLVVDKIQNHFEISTYPNPVDDFLTIESKESFAGKEIKIYNTIGSLVLTKQLRSERENISVSGLPSGIYYYSISRKDGNLETGKLLKK